MPVPRYFNGHANQFGKGTAKLNKDYPYEYWKNLKDRNSRVCKREEMRQWLENNMEKYRIKDMYNLKPPYSVDEYYGYISNKTVVDDYSMCAVLTDPPVSQTSIWFSFYTTDQTYHKALNKMKKLIE